MCRFCDQQIDLLLRPLAAPDRSATSSARWCTMTRVALGWFGWWYDATAGQLAALAAAMPASCSGRHPAVGSAGFGGGGSGGCFCCFCLLTGVCGRCWVLIWLRQVGRLLWASGDGLGCCWRALDSPARCVPCAPPRPVARPVLTQFPCLRCCCIGCRCAAAPTTGAVVVCAYGLALASAVRSFSVCAVSGGRDF